MSLATGVEKVASPSRSPGGARLGQDIGREARRQAAAILEVLAGVRTPTEAFDSVSFEVGMRHSRTAATP